MGSSQLPQLASILLIEEFDNMAPLFLLRFLACLRSFLLFDYFSR